VSSIVYFATIATNTKHQINRTIGSLGRQPIGTRIASQAQLGIHCARRLSVKPNHRNIREPIHRRLSALLFLFLLPLLAGCSSIVLESRWREGQTTIDGVGAAWRDTLVLLDDKKTFLGLLNDNDYLYIRIVTTNRDFEGQIVRQGLTWWFDRDGGEKKQFGVRFPLGIGRSSEMREFRRDRNEKQQRRRRDSIFVPVNDLEIFGPDEGSQHRMTFAQATGIDARFRTSLDTLTYTLKVPISSSGYFPYTIGSTPGTMVGIAVETLNTGGAGRASEGEGDEGGRRGGGYGGRGGYGGSFGGRGGFGGGGFGGGRPGASVQTKPFSQFVKVRLATSPPESQ
jgi:hypothetical protein